MRLFILLLFLGSHYFSFGQNVLVEEFKIQGNKKLKTSFINKVTLLKAGAILDSLVIENDMIRLKQLPSVSHATYQVIPLNENQSQVIYTIEENFTIIPSVNVYTTNEDEFAYRIGLYEFNLFGQNMIFGGFYQKDIYSSYAVNFRALKII
jgi:outer membrane protein assembly factor BamA